jgi:hypothetical protein
MRVCVCPLRGWGELHRHWSLEPWFSVPQKLGRKEGKTILDARAKASRFWLGAMNFAGAVRKNYAYHHGLRVSTAPAESGMTHLVNQRMGKKQSMRRSAEGLTSCFRFVALSSTVNWRISLVCCSPGYETSVPSTNCRAHGRLLRCRGWRHEIQRSSSQSNRADVRRKIELGFPSRSKKPKVNILATDNRHGSLIQYETFPRDRKQMTKGSIMNTSFMDALGRLGATVISMVPASQAVSAP